MLGDNDQVNEGAPLPRGHAPAFARGDVRGDVVVHDRGRGYGAAQDWWDEEPREAREIDVVKYWHMLRKHWLMIVASVFVAVAMGVVVTMLTPRVYTARATLQIDRESARVVNVQRLDVPEASTGDEFFQTQHAIIKSRLLAQDAVRDHGLARDPAVIRALGIPLAKNARIRGSEMDEAVIGAVQNRLAVAPVQRSRIVAVTFDSYDPNVSARVVNAVADAFIDSQLKRRLEKSRAARAFLQEQLDKQKAALEESDRKLVEYARANQIISIPTAGITTGGTEGGGKVASGGSTSLTGASLSDLNGMLSTARQNRIRAEAKWARAQGDAAGLPDVLLSPTIQLLKQAQFKLDADYRALRAELVEGGRADQPLTENRASRAALDREIAAEINNIKASIRSQYEAALAEERSLEGQVNRLRSGMLDLRDRSIEYDILAREADTNKELFDNLLQSLQEVGVAGDVRANNVSILDVALPPGGPSKPRPVRNILTAAILGLVIGIGLALTLELFDESIRSPEDLEKKVGLPLLGTIPRLEKGVTPQEALSDLRSAFAEAYYSVRTALQFSTNEGAPRSLLVTSARPSEGKSTTATAIAVNFARLGMRVLLIDGDLRNPSLHRAFGVENSAGFSNYLTGGKTLDEVSQPTDTPNLRFVPCGPLPPSPAELLAGPQLQLLLADAERSFDVVVIDGPPVMGLADAPMLAAGVAGTVLVIESGGTGRKLAKVAIRRLNVGHARILGAILTKFDARKNTYGHGYGYGYAYDYDYGARPALKDGT
jgi:polysaccharide biosynthesis transport protein